MSILHTLPLRERPSYKISAYGEAQCTMIDLLAILLGGPKQIDLAYTLIGRFGSLSALTRASVVEIQEVDGIGPALAGRVKAALELGKRLTLESLEEQPVIRSPGDAASIVMPELSHLEQEHFVVLMLDARNRLMYKQTLYKGNGGVCHVRPCEVFQEAVRRGAISIVALHNHPTGDATPSPEDVATTRQLFQAGELLGIDLIDHIILGRNRFVSLKERGLGFR